MQRLSSGLRVNVSKDDAAGMAIASRLETQVRGMNVPARNANDAIPLVQTAEGAMAKATQSPHPNRYLPVHAPNPTHHTTLNHTTQPTPAR